MLYIDGKESSIYSQVPHLRVRESRDLDVKEGNLGQNQYNVLNERQFSHAEDRTKSEKRTAVKNENKFGAAGIYV